MNHKLNWSIILSITAVVFVLLISVGCTVLLQKQKNLQIKNQSNKVDSVNTSDWKTYRNEQYGFEFKYPANWSHSYINGDEAGIRSHDLEKETGKSPIYVGNTQFCSQIDNQVIADFTYRLSGSYPIDISIHRVVLNQNVYVSEGYNSISEDESTPKINLLTSDVSKLDREIRSKLGSRENGIEYFVLGNQEVKHFLPQSCAWLFQDEKTEGFQFFLDHKLLISIEYYYVDPKQGYLFENIISTFKSI